MIEGNIPHSQRFRREPLEGHSAGKEADALSQLPLDALPLSEAQMEILDSWGIRKCRDLALLAPKVSIIAASP
jgi:hypothetical protein